TFIADALIRAARAVRLLGAHVVLTGISPEVAQTLVSLGADLSVFETRATLQDGMALAINGELAGRKGSGLAKR
ncbi:MAG: STAS domain-containing protein, partial [Chloroflexus sp.]